MYYLIIILTAMSSYKGGVSVEVQKFDSLHDCNIVGKTSKEMVRANTNKRISYQCVKGK